MHKGPKCVDSISIFNFCFSNLWSFHCFKTKVFSISEQNTMTQTFRIGAFVATISLSLSAHAQYTYSNEVGLSAF